ncbi:MAG: alpha-L-fucosidase C-terminal domain-containing protein [Bacteroidales bacterium]|nr:alpha-L-fucosidase C-terminal domain-containing protein [Bacteroidales bacterium]
MGTYRCTQPTVCYTTQNDTLYAIAIEYPQNQLILNIPKPDKNVSVSLLGCDKNLPWSYKNGQMIIDTRSLLYNDLKSTAAWTFRICQ